MVPETLSKMKPFLLMAMVAILGCQGGDLTLPSDGLPALLREVSGSGQSGTVGSQLPDPLVVQVQDGAGRPVENVSLSFDTQVQGAKVLQPEVTPTAPGEPRCWFDWAASREPRGLKRSWLRHPN